MKVSFSSCVFLVDGLSEQSTSRHVQLVAYLDVYGDEPSEQRNCSLHFYPLSVSLLSEPRNSAPASLSPSL